MSILDEEMRLRMDYINASEHRSFSFLDFEGMMSHGTFRNKVSKLLRNGEIYICKGSKPRFYCLRKYDLGRDRGRHSMMTDNETGVNNCNYSHYCHYKDKNDCKICYLSKMLSSIPPTQAGLHDIHLSFTLPDVWQILSDSGRYRRVDKSKDIVLLPHQINDLTIKVNIHHRDTVTVSVACSRNPIVEDIGGVIRLSSALTRMEE